MHQLGCVAVEKALISLTRNDYEPDICYWNSTKAADFLPTQMQFPAPDLVVEILSKSTEKHDRGIKFDDYAAHGIGEYWLIDADRKMVEQYFIDKKTGTYALHQKGSTGSIKSKAIKQFEIPIQAIFDEKLNIQTLKKLM
jgi:Uma2 family endonuclease